MGNDVAGNSFGLTKGNIPEFAKRDRVKPRKPSSRDSRSPGRDLKRRASEYEAELLPTLLVKSKFVPVLN
jgi:hypothetical protein